MTDVYVAQPIAVVNEYSADRDRAALEQAEMAAFEKGRMQGEMEAIRRVEAENQKQMLPVVNNNTLALHQRPDVVEINRLTRLQRAAFVLGSLAGLATLGLVIAWAIEYGSGFDWDAGTGQGNALVSMWNTGLLTGILGLAFLGHAITHYRVLPLNLSAGINRAWYIFLQSCAIVCFSMTMAANVLTQPEATFWGVDQWCFAFGFALAMSHSVYSIAHALLERPVDHKQWAEHGNQLESPEQARDKSAFNAHGRAAYAPAPVRLHHTTHVPASANVGAQVPVAPGLAPRWSEVPTTHAEDYFLLPRAKWATIGFLSIGASILMMIAGLQQVRAVGGRTHWAQYPNDPEYRMDEVGQEAKILGAAGLLLIIALGLHAYVAMPPRTTLVKNGVLVDPTGRRTSVSTTHTERIHGQNIV